MVVHFVAGGDAETNRIVGIKVTDVGKKNKIMIGNIVPKLNDPRKAVVSLRDGERIVGVTFKKPLDKCWLPI